MFTTALLLVLLGASASGASPERPEVFRVLPPGERVLQAGTPGISAVVIVEGGGADQGGRLYSDLRGAVRMELGGVTLEVRDGHGRALDPGAATGSALDGARTRRLQLHDFFAFGLQTLPVFAETTPLDQEGRRWSGENPAGESGTLYRDERGRVSGYDVRGPGEEALEVRFLEWTRVGDLEVPARVRTLDSTGEHVYRLGGFREEPMPESGPAAPRRWRDEGELPEAAGQALAAERAFALASRTSGMKAAFLEWLVGGATVFAPGPMPVEQRFAGVPDAPAEQPALEWLPEWIVLAGSSDLAAISGRWNLRPPDAELPTAFGQYLSVWQRGPDGWRVVADIGTSQDEPRPLTSRATGRVVEMRAPRVMMVPDAAELARQVEQELEDLAFRDGYRAALEQFCDPDVIVLREGAVAGRAVESISVPDAVAELAPRIEVTGSAAAASYDLVATWGVLHFDADPSRRFAFLRFWQLETTRWQVAADVLCAMP